LSNTVTRYAEIDGATSPIRLKGSQEMLFVVKLASGIDPSVFQLFPLARKKDTRRIKNDIKNGTEYLTLPLDVKKYGESSYSLTPANALAPGEYALSSKRAPRTKGMSRVARALAVRSKSSGQIAVARLRPEGTPFSHSR
jgi:hypothetical protein